MTIVTWNGFMERQLFESAARGAKSHSKVAVCVEGYSLTINLDLHFGRIINVRWILVICCIFYCSADRHHETEERISAIGRAVSLDLVSIPPRRGSAKKSCLWTVSSTIPAAIQVNRIRHRRNASLLLPAVSSLLPPPCF
jgi:hypothetical protein